MPRSRSAAFRQRDHAFHAKTCDGRPWGGVDHVEFATLDWKPMRFILLCRLINLAIVRTQRRFKCSFVCFLTGSMGIFVKILLEAVPIALLYAGRDLFHIL